MLSIVELSSLLNFQTFSSSATTFVQGCSLQALSRQAVRRWIMTYPCTFFILSAYKLTWTRSACSTVSSGTTGRHDLLHLQVCVMRMRSTTWRRLSPWSPVNCLLTYLRIHATHEVHKHCTPSGPAQSKESNKLRKMVLTSYFNHIKHFQISDCTRQIIWKLIMITRRELIDWLTA